MKSIKAYNCTQSELYAMCASGWESCNENLAAFASLKPKYTSEFIEARKAEIAEVTRIPDRYKRVARQEMLRMNLKTEAGKCLKVWKKLRSHIQEAWPGDESSPMLKSAGMAIYREAYKLKWEAVHNLIVSVDTFIKENTEKLQAGNNMSASFAAEVSALSDAFASAYFAFLDSLKLKEQTTARKISANNKLYRELNAMFSDARLLFDSEDKLLKQFNFKALLIQISGPGTAGINGSISLGGLNPDELPDIELELMENKEKADIEDDGSFRFSQMAAGPYTLKLTADGYAEQIIPVVVQTGVYTKLKLELKKAELPEG